MIMKKFNEWNRNLIPETKLSDEELQLLKLPLEQRQIIKNQLELHINESFMSSIKDFISRKMMSWLINRNEKEIRKTIDTLTIFDPEDFSNIKKPEIIYLGGGMDKPKDGGVGWRIEFENHFGPEHVVNREDIFKLGYKSKLDTNKYKKPILLDPTIKEIIREDPYFMNKWSKLKAQTIDEPGLKYMAKTINKEITNPDLRIVNKCDTIFAKLDGSQGPGTLGELQVATLLRLNVFAWLTGDYQLKDLNLWIIPEINKIVRTDDEVLLLINKIKEVNG